MEFLEQYDPPGIQLGALSALPAGLTSSQLAALGEDELAAAILVGSRGLASIAFPIVDRGFDAYVRRVGTLQTIPVQVKARRTLRADGGFVAYIRAASLRNDPFGYLILVYLPPPELRLYQHAWIIPIPYFLEHCPRSGNVYAFESHLDGSRRSPWNAFLVNTADLGASWLFRIPGWEPSALATPAEGRAPGAAALGGFGELWIAAQLELAGGMHLAVARERVDVDMVDLLLHDQRRHRFAGLQVKTGRIDRRGVVQFHLPQSTFFVDDRLVVVVVPIGSTAAVHETCFMIPSAAIPTLTTVSSHKGRPEYHGSVHLDPVSAKYTPFAQPRERVGHAIARLLA